MSEEPAKHNRKISDGGRAKEMIFDKPGQLSRSTSPGTSALDLEPQKLAGHVRPGIC